MCGKSPTGLMTGAGRYLTDLNQETSLAGDSTNDALVSASARTAVSPVPLVPIGFHLDSIWVACS